MITTYYENKCEHQLHNYLGVFKTNNWNSHKQVHHLDVFKHDDGLCLRYGDKAEEYLSYLSFPQIIQIYKDTKDEFHKELIRWLESKIPD